MTVINTYNETNLHKTLKNIYSLENNGKTEKKLGPYICDIITEDNLIIEIQTSNVSALNKKINYVLTTGKKIKVIHPLIEEKIIETYDLNGKLLSKRKSQVTQTIYTALRGLTGITDLLTKDDLTLEVLSVSVTEIRIKTEEKTQNLNKSRRHLKNYLIKGKILNSINSKTVYQTKNDWAQLIPNTLPHSFTTTQLKKSLEEQLLKWNLNKFSIKKSISYYNLLLWFLIKMDLIIKTDKKEGNCIVYQKKI